MSYTKHEFKSGEKLFASQLNEMDEQIYNNSEAIDDLLPKNQGAANVGKILVVGTDGNLVLTDMPEGGASGDVVGVFDESNNILLSGDIAVGTYTLVFANTDGTYTGSGTLEVTEIVPNPSYNNLAKPDDAYWKDGYRLSISNGTTSECEGHVVTNFIAAKAGDVLRVKGMYITGEWNSQAAKIVLYNIKDNESSKVSGLYGSGLYGTSNYGKNVATDGDVSTITILLDNTGEQSATSFVNYLRIDGGLLDGYTKNDVVITINEEITE